MRKYVKYTLTQRKMSVKLHSTAQHSTAQHSTAQHSTNYLFVFSDRKYLTLTDKKINCRHAGGIFIPQILRGDFLRSKIFRRRKIHAE